MNASKHLIVALAVSFLFAFSAIAQTVTFNAVTNLSATLGETSGLLYLNGNLITHNDGGSAVALFQIDSITGNVSKTVNIGGASNYDWEDITMDNDFIYIGDIGNNFGNRQGDGDAGLKIYRISKSEFLAAANNATVNAEAIHYAYADQSDFTSRDQNNDWDAEALIAYNDSLYLFTKNWVSKKTNVYSLPKTPTAVANKYQSKRVAQLEVATLVTGADYNETTAELMMTGYDLSQFGVVTVIKLEGLVGNAFSTAKMTKKTIAVTGNFQVEAVAWFKNDQCYISSESNRFLGSAWLGRIHWPYSGTPVGVKELSVSPNPANNHLFVAGNEVYQTYVFDINGRLLITSTENPIDLRQLEHGIYIFKFNDQNGVLVDRKIVMVK